MEPVEEQAQITPPEVFPTSLYDMIGYLLREDKAHLSQEDIGTLYTRFVASMGPSRLINPFTTWFGNQDDEYWNNHHAIQKKKASFEKFTRRRFGDAVLGYWVDKKERKDILPEEADTPTLPFADHPLIISPKRQTIESCLVAVGNMPGMPIYSPNYFEAIGKAVYAGAGVCSTSTSGQDVPFQALSQEYDAIRSQLQQLMQGIPKGM